MGLVIPHPTGGNAEGAYLSHCPQEEECALHKFPVVLAGPSEKTQLMKDYLKFCLQVFLL